MTKITPLVSIMNYYRDTNADVLKTVVPYQTSKSVGSLTQPVIPLLLLSGISRVGKIICKRLCPV